VRSLWMPVALLGLLWIGLTCTTVPAPESSALSSANEWVATACERALASLAPDPEPARRAPVSFPVEVGPALRALHGTGMGGRVVALEVVVERAARLALADVKPQLEQAVAAFSPEAPDALVAGSDDALSVAFRAASEADLRAALRPAAEQRLGEAGAPDALQGVRDGASRLPLPRKIELDLVSVVTDQAVASFFTALTEEERRLRQERVALLRTGREEIR
jgi:hypothetical protein